MNSRKQYSGTGRVLNDIGCILMVAVIAVTIPLNVPKWCGLQIYEVLTGSMEPEYPVGSIVYVKPTEATEVKEGDVITYTLESDSKYVMTHRVTEVFTEEQAYCTKGDSNTAEDIKKVHFDRLIGKPVFCIPYFGFISEAFHTTAGKAVCICVFFTALFLWLSVEFSFRRVLKWAGIGMISLSLTGLALIIADYRRGTAEYEKLQDYVTADSMKVKDIRKTVAEETEEAVYIPEIQIAQRLSELQEKNAQVIGWLAFDELDISYPIMQAEDNVYYLTHTFSETENKAGSIFMDAGNTKNFTDYHNIIYGHNMKNRTMFGWLKKYYEKAFYEGNEFFTIYTEKQAYRYEIFSVHMISETDEVYTIWFAPGEETAEYTNYVERLKSRAWYDTGVNVTGKDKIVTLSTCTASDDKRFVIHGKLAAVYLFESEPEG